MSFKLFGCLSLITMVLQITLFCSAPVCAQDSTRQEVILQLQTSNQSVQADYNTDSWYADDKIRHLVGSLVSTTLLTQVSSHNTEWSKREAKIFAVGTTMSLGFVKELYDRRKPGNHFCWKDLAADTVGVILGLVILGIK